MADAAQGASSTSAQGESGASPRRPRGSRPRGGGGQGERGGGGGREGGRGGGGGGGHRSRRGGSGGGSSRGGGGRAQQDRNGTVPISPTQSATSPRLASAGAGEPVAPLQRTMTTESEAEVCFICASPIEHLSIAPCNHQTCHICALRLRALYKSKACAHCRTNAPYVIFTDDRTRRYEDFAKPDFSRTDDNLGIHYANENIFEDSVLLLRYNCPDATCDVACMGWPDLHRHVRNVHHKVLCDLCTRNKKVFTHEHTLFTKNGLRQHEVSGDDTPGAVDQSGFTGHPECGFCRQRFYGADELYGHCRDKHERCHLCDRRSNGQNPQYYVNYDALEEHFRKDHFLCLDRECLEKKFVVFDSEMDLKAHQLEQHPNGLTKDARRDARRVDMAGFDYRATHEQERGSGRREGRGRGRGRDPNADAPLPLSSAQPLSRAQLAYQRQMAVQSAQSVTTRSFGGQLTSSNNTAGAGASSQPARSNTPSNAAAAATDTNANGGPASAMRNLTIQDSTSTTARSSSPRPGAVSTGAAAPTTGNTPQDQARALRHAAVTERATSLLKNDSSKLSTFRDRISAYRTSSISAAELIDAFFSLFDASADHLGTLVRELAELFEVPEKKASLLQAWSDWNAINEDYPSLPGPAGVPAGTSASALASGGSRVLTLKKSTAQSSRAAGGRAPAPPKSWNATAAPSNPFPALGAGPATSRPGAGAAGLGRPQWRAASPARTPAVRTTANAAGGATGSGGGARGTGLGNADAFPALPAAVKPTSTLFTPGYSGSGVLRVGGGNAGVNAWSGAGRGAGSAASNASIPGAAALGEDGGEAAGQGGGKKKGNKGKKQMLFQWG